MRFIWVGISKVKITHSVYPIHIIHKPYFNVGLCLNIPTACFFILVPFPLSMILHPTLIPEVISIISILFNGRIVSWIELPYS